MDKERSATAVLQERLQELLKVRGKSAELARLAGVDPSTVSEWQSGKYFPALDKLDAIAAVMNVPVSDLFVPLGAAPSRTTPLLVSSVKGSVHDAAHASKARGPAEESTFQHIARLAIEQLDENARVRIFVDCLPGVARRVGRQSSRRSSARSSNSSSVRTGRGKIA